MQSRALLWVVFVGLPACTADAVITPGGPPEHHDIQLTDPSPPMRLRIESCKLDADACPDLCNAVARANNFGGPVSGCNVTFDSTTTYIGIDVSGFAVAGGAG